MVRVKRGNVAIKRRKKIFKFAKGYTGAHSRLFRTANQQVMKALVYSYVGRKRRKRDFRSLWICRVNAAARSYGLTYSRLKNLLKTNSISINLKLFCKEEVFEYLIVLCCFFARTFFSVRVLLGEVI